MHTPFRPGGAYWRAACLVVILVNAACDRQLLTGVTNRQTTRQCAPKGPVPGPSSSLEEPQAALPCGEQSEVSLGSEHVGGGGGGRCVQGGEEEEGFEGVVLEGDCQYL